jgi:membrane fusion protein (multidrug efflux system)
VIIENPDGVLRPGMTVRARLVKREFDNAIVVPQDAVVNSDEGTGVFLAVDGAAESRAVEVEAVYDEMAVIRSGLSGGERLITTGARDLVQGEPIEVVGSGEAHVDH